MKRSQSELVLDAAWRIFEGSTRLRHAEAQALLQAYREAQATITQIRIEAQRHARDAAAQRALVERLTNELDKREQR